MIDMLVKAGDVGLSDDDPITLRLTIGNACLSKGTPRRRPIKQSIALLRIPIGMGAVTAERLVCLGDGDPKAIQIDVPERVNLGRDPEPAAPVGTNRRSEKTSNELIVDLTLSLFRLLSSWK
jgi:hypothetical protein